MSSDLKMIDDVLGTYRCVLSHRKNMPGSSLEDILNDDAVQSMKEEEAWLLKLRQSLVSPSESIPSKSS